MLLCSCSCWLISSKLGKITPHVQGREITQQFVRKPFGISPRCGFVQHYAQDRSLWSLGCFATGRRAPLASIRWLSRMNPTFEQQHVLNTLESAYRDKDADAVERALCEAYRIGLDPCMQSVLVDLCEAGWHSRHEDVVSALQKVGGSPAVQALERTASAVFGYLDYDEFFGLARKCTWALADIGTQEAQSALTRIASSSNSIVASYAKKRLESWQDELHRKRAQQGTLPRSFQSPDAAR